MGSACEFGVGFWGILGIFVEEWDWGQMGLPRVGGLYSIVALCAWYSDVV